MDGTLTLVDLPGYPYRVLAATEPFEPVEQIMNRYARVHVYQAGRCWPVYSGPANGAGHVLDAGTYTFLWDAVDLWDMG